MSAFAIRKRPGFDQMMKLKRRRQPGKQPANRSTPVAASQ
jgi:hypothetical protein